MGIFELRTNWQEDLFWCKFLLSGEGCYCPELTIDGCTKPIQYGQDCCLESSCGLRPNGKIIGCFPHPTEDFWCAHKCCCYKHYCGVPCLGGGNGELDIWFQLCCIKIGKPFAFELVTSNFTKGFCWGRCFCVGEGLDCDNMDIMAMMKPMCLSVSCCCASDCGLFENGEIAGCIPHPMNQACCRHKCLCIQSYFSLASCLADPVQILPVALFVDMCGMGSPFEPIKGGDGPQNVDNII
jgi:hypothetical protein